MVDSKVFAQSIINQVHAKWLSLKQFEHAEELKYCWRNGFAVFYSPVTVEPDLMILGFNPGGGPDDFNEAEACELPIEHDYLKRNYVLAKRMREELFVGNQSLLRESVKANLIPFRTSNKSEWYRIQKRLRAELEEFSRGVCREVVKTIKPRMILLEGVQTFDLFCRWFAEDIVPLQSPFGHQVVRGRRIYCDAKMRYGPKVVGVVHLSGARPRPGAQDIEYIQDRLQREMGLPIK